MHERRIGFRSWTLWTAVHGAATSGAPILCVPGGPGVPHEACAVLAEGAPAARPIVFYDPSGSGRSDRPAGVAWDLELFVDEIEAVRAALGLDRVHLFGASFGGLASLVYALRRPAGLLSLTLVGASASMPASRAALRRSIEAMPEVRDVLLGPEGSTAYIRAYYQWASRRLCRVPMPRALSAAMAAANMEAFRLLKGGGPIGWGGTLRDVDVTDRLAALDVPALLAYGAHDPFVPEVADALCAALPRGRLAIFPDSAHVPEHEEPDAFRRALFGFVAEVEGAHGGR